MKTVLVARPVSKQEMQRVEKANQAVLDEWDKLRKVNCWRESEPLLRSEVQKKLMLERFGEENPGFDFSGAEFSGGAPDPRNFMGGVKYK